MGPALFILFLAMCGAAAYGYFGHWREVSRDETDKHVVRVWRNWFDVKIEVRSDKIGGEASCCWYDTSTGAMSLVLGSLSEQAERVLKWKNKGG